MTHYTPPFIDTRMKGVVLKTIILLGALIFGASSWAVELINEQEMFQLMMSEQVVGDVPGFGLTKIAKHTSEKFYSPNHRCSPFRGSHYGSVSCGALAAEIDCRDNECMIHDAYSGKVVRVNDGAYGMGAAQRLSASLCHITNHQGCESGQARLTNFLCEVTYSTNYSGVAQAVNCYQAM